MLMWSQTIQSQGYGWYSEYLPRIFVTKYHLLDQVEIFSSTTTSGIWIFGRLCQFDRSSNSLFKDNRH